MVTIKLQNKNRKVFKCMGASGTLRKLPCGKVIRKDRSGDNGKSGRCTKCRNRQWDAEQGIERDKFGHRLFRCVKCNKYPTQWVRVCHKCKIKKLN